MQWLHSTILYMCSLYVFKLLRHNVISRSLGRGGGGERERQEAGKIGGGGGERERQEAGKIE